MPNPTSPTPAPAPLIPATVDEVKKFWMIFLGVVAIIGWLLSGFFGYSWKQVSDAKSQAVTIHSEGVTITKWQDIGGKAYPVTIVKTVHDSGKSQTETKVTTTIRTSCTLGAFHTSRGFTGGYLSPEIYGFGPGAFSVLAAGSQDELIGGIGYNLNF